MRSWRFCCVCVCQLPCLFAFSKQAHGLHVYPVLGMDADEPKQNLRGPQRFLYDAWLKEGVATWKDGKTWKDFFP